VTLLVDDRVLSLLLRGESPAPLVATGDAIFTTGYWYVRLCQAVLGVAERPGALSSPFTSLPPEGRDQALAAVLELPEEIGLLSLRELAPVIARLRARHQLNILGMEALAAAVQLDARVVLSARSPRLEEALLVEARRFEVVD
jgi:hypothetical protein